MQEYTLTRGGKIFVLTVVLTMLAASLGAMIIPLFIGMPNDKIIYLYPAFAGLAAFMLYCLFKVNEKVIIDDHTIKVRSTLRKRELLLEQIKGFRNDGEYLHLVPYAGYGPKIKVSSWVGNFGGLLQWAAARYPDLDEVEVRETYERPVAGDQATIEPRLKKARESFIILNGAIIVLALLPIALGNDTWWRLSLLMLCPLAAIFLLYRHQGLVQIGDQQKNPAPSVFTPIVLSTAILYLQTSRSMHLLNYERIWIPVILTGIVLGGLFWYGGRHFNWRKPAVIIIGSLVVLCFFADGYAFLLQLNRLTEKEEAKHFQARVSNKRISTGSRRSGNKKTYYLQLQPWGPQTAVDEVAVPADLYEQVSLNGAVSVHLHKGGLGIQWYNVTLPFDE